MQNLGIGLILVIFTGCLYLVYLKKAKDKIKKSAKKSLRIFIQNSIRIFGIFLIIAMLENFLSKETIENFLLKFSGIKGILAGEFVGAIIMGPIASGYPLAKYLLNHGAEVATVTAFLLAWVMIRIISIPMEFKELGKKFTITRNLFALFSIVVISLIMEMIL